AGGDSIFGARRAHADYFLSTEIGRDESEPGDPGRQRPTRKEEIFTGLHVSLQRTANTQHEDEINQHDGPIDDRQLHCLESSLLLSTVSSSSIYIQTVGP